jgi:hypothetical protein
MEEARQQIGSHAVFANQEERQRVLAVYERGMETLRGKGNSPPLGTSP